MLYIVVGELVVCNLPIISEGNSLPSLLGALGCVVYLLHRLLLRPLVLAQRCMADETNALRHLLFFVIEGSRGKFNQMAVIKELITFFAIFWGVLWIVGAWRVSCPRRVCHRQGESAIPETLHV